MINRMPSEQMGIASFSGKDNLIFCTVLDNGNGTILAPKEAEGFGVGDKVALKNRRYTILAKMIRNQLRPSDPVLVEFAIQ
jgi:hypothetical protein